MKKIVGALVVAVLVLVLVASADAGQRTRRKPFSVYVGNTKSDPPVCIESDSNDPATCLTYYQNLWGEIRILNRTDRYLQLKCLVTVQAVEAGTSTGGRIINFQTAVAGPRNGGTITLRPRGNLNGPYHAQWSQQFDYSPPGTTFEGFWKVRCAEV